MAEVQTGRMTFEEFLAWCDEDTWAEWENGEVLVLTPASMRHQLLKKFLVGLLDAYAQAKDLGVILDAPFVMKLGPDLPAREPDILFVAKENLGRLRETHLDGPADLVVEIVSPESAARDRGVKFYEYEAAGVREYWLIDPEREEAEFYVLREGRYRLVYPEAGIFRSLVLPGFWLSTFWLWRKPLPPVLTVLKELGVV